MCRSYFMDPLVRDDWPDRVVVFSTAIGLLGITVLSVYLILEH